MCWPYGAARPALLCVCPCPSGFLKFFSGEKEERSSSLESLENSRWKFWSGQTPVLGSWLVDRRAQAFSCRAMLPGLLIISQ
jgi:hypothetical protein